MIISCNSFSVHPLVAIKLNGLKEVHAALIKKKLSTLPKTDDVTWP